MVKVCIYARVSTKGQDYERQLEELRRYASQMEYDIVREFSAWVQSLGWEDPLEKGNATHSSILAWRIPWTA